MGYKKINILSFVIMLLGASSLQAQEIDELLADIPAPDEWRFISIDDATSKCIGDPKTPLCAVETVIACFARMDISLCQRVGQKGKTYLGEDARKVHYKIINARVLTEKDMEADFLKNFSKHPNWWKPGFVKFTLSSPDDGKNCSTKYCSFDHAVSLGNECCYTDYIVNPIGKYWHVISWTAWGDS